MPPYAGYGDGTNRETLLTFLRRSSAINFLSTPIVYSLGFPLVLLDIWTTAYQWICFPMYGIALVPRRTYFVIDRHRLRYLNPIEKLHCFYCSYATGLFAYVAEIAARTEQYWCPIRHATPVHAPHDHYQLFFEYGDAASYRQGLPDVRRRLAGPLAPRPRIR
jgi:hypothetical protein